ncbi:CHAD domain-containing protein [Kitasatospora sp. NPDC006697]|uniref:CYTH and CHAD domain-containing protein n=1 Tax=Kitasatospora sp. NPDC006697 TaxID=3364020 RepID=UPI00369A5C3B
MTVESARRAVRYQGVPQRPVRARGLAKVEQVVRLDPGDLLQVCWDTADLRLLAHGGALQHRADSARGWLLTLPDGTEHRAPDAGAVPAELGELVRAYTGGRPLHPVLRIGGHRHRTVLLDRRRRPLARLDRTEATAQLLGTGQVSGWDRTELRLLRGKRRLLRELDGRLRAQGLAPGTGDPVPGFRPPEPPAPRPGSAGAALTAYLRAQCAQLLALDGAVRRDEADSVHRMRVCARRLRSALAAGRRWLRRDDGVSEELRWLGRVLGVARDAETTGERLVAAAGDGPSAGLLAEAFRERYARAAAEVREVQQSERYFALLAAVERLAAEPPLRRRAERGGRHGRAELERLLRREQRRTGRRLDAALALPPGPERDEALHAARKAAKRGRYAAELAGADRLASRLHGLQQTLGAYQDAVVAERLLPELAAAPGLPARAAFDYGRLYAAQRPLAEAALADTPEAWRRARKHKLCVPGAG